MDGSVLSEPRVPRWSNGQSSLKRNGTPVQSPLPFKTSKRTSSTSTSSSSCHDPTEARQSAIERPGGDSLMAWSSSVPGYGLKQPWTLDLGNTAYSASSSPSYSPAQSPTTFGTFPPIPSNKIITIAEESSSAPPRLRPRQRHSSSSELSVSGSGRSAIAQIETSECNKGSSFDETHSRSSPIPNFQKESVPERLAGPVTNFNPVEETQIVASDSRVPDTRVSSLIASPERISEQLDSSVEGHLPTPITPSSSKLKSTVTTSIDLSQELDTGTEGTSSDPKDKHLRLVSPAHVSKQAPNTISSSISLLAGGTPEEDITRQPPYSLAQSSISSLPQVQVAVPSPLVDDPAQDHTVIEQPSAQSTETSSAKPSDLSAGPSKIPIAELEFHVDENNTVKLGKDLDGTAPTKPKLKRLKLSFSHYALDYPPVDPISASTSEESAYDVARSVISFSDGADPDTEALFQSCKPEFSDVVGFSVWRCPHPWCTGVYKQRNGLKYHLRKGKCRPRSGTSTPDVDLRRLVIDKAHHCPNSGCPKRFGSYGGLRYHLSRCLYVSGNTNNAQSTPSSQHSSPLPSLTPSPVSSRPTTPMFFPHSDIDMFTEEFYNDLITYDLASNIMAEKDSNDGAQDTRGSPSSSPATSSDEDPLTSNFVLRDIERDWRFRSEDLIPNRQYFRVDDIISALSEALLQVDGTERPNAFQNDAGKENQPTVRTIVTPLRMLKPSNLPDHPTISPGHPCSHTTRKPLPSFRGQCSIILGDPSKATTPEFWSQSAQDTFCKLKNKGFKFTLLDSLLTPNMAKIVCICECIGTGGVTSNRDTIGTCRESPLQLGSSASTSCGGILEVFVDRDISHPVEGIVGLRTQISVRHPQNIYND
ncbi:hypothetical protein SCHPADRAFT_998444 [Schizopora paradoxa]|uniref:Uncharacterized protein n=1 Tax=Schizopora paradoxa TaxID=27342 RepID=A0A0H2RJN8_9AGAM|nr:hypothetical protein SCHPADRAFT_998444 [Schizopora paradoxa]